MTSVPPDFYWLIRSVRADMEEWLWTERLWNRTAYTCRLPCGIGEKPAQEKPSRRPGK